MELHWAFSAARKTIEEHGDQELYTCASGVTPSGIIHIGNFREIITVDLVKRAFKRLGKKVRHLHSWDNYDVFRKVPKHMPNQEMLHEHLRKSIVDTPDPYGEFPSYAARYIHLVEQALPLVGITPEYKYQAELYQTCAYKDEIKRALAHTPDIKDILNKYRTEPLKESWLPIAIFSKDTGRDDVQNLAWKGEYIISYEENKKTQTIDFSKESGVKLVWRVDWPMRWHVEHVHFEPGGKDHSSVGGSFDTAKHIVAKVWHSKAPTYIMYDFIRIKGGSGKISSSSGDVITLTDVLEIYEPEIVRYLFAGTRPNTEFAISFDSDVIKIYEDFDKCERIYYKKETVSEKEYEKQKLIYELSQIAEDITEIPPEMPPQVPLREVTMMLCIKDLDIERTVAHYQHLAKTERDIQRLRNRITCAKNWLETYADEQFTFIVRTSKNETLFSELTAQEQEALASLKAAVEKSATVEELAENIFAVPKQTGLDMKNFFRISYQALITKDRGPRLANFIMEIGKEKVLQLL